MTTPFLKAEESQPGRWFMFVYTATKQSVHSSSLFLYLILSDLPFGTWEWATVFTECAALTADLMETFMAQFCSIVQRAGKPGEVWWNE